MRQIDLDGFDFEDHATPPREKLRRYVSGQRERASGRFTWLDDIVNETLDAYVRKRLDDGFDPDRFNPSRFQDNLRECSRLVDTCLVQRSEIFELESQAVTSALEILYTLRSLDADSALETTQLAAVCIQAGIPGDTDSFTALERKFTLRRQELNEREALHAGSGNALNYGERVAFLRNIYLENLQRVNECMYALQFWLTYAYDITVDRKIDYAETQVDVLENSVAWLRRCVDLFEAKMRNAKFARVCIHAQVTGESVTLKTKLPGAKRGAIVAVRAGLAYHSDYDKTLMELLAAKSTDKETIAYRQHLEDMLLKDRESRYVDVQMSGPIMTATYGRRKVLYVPQGVIPGVTAWTDTTKLDALTPADTSRIAEFPIDTPLSFGVALTDAIFSQKTFGKYSELVNGDDPIMKDLTRVVRIGIYVDVIYFTS